jgi:hypothetical protein
MKKGPSRQKGGDPARERKRGTRDQLKKETKEERESRKKGRSSAGSAHRHINCSIRGGSVAVACLGGRQQGPGQNDAVSGQARSCRPRHRRLLFDPIKRPRGLRQSRSRGGCVSRPA